MIVTFTALTVVSGLSIDVRRNSYIEDLQQNEDVLSYQNIAPPIEEVSLSKSIYFNHKQELIKNVTEYLQQECTDNKVQRNTILILEQLTSFFVENINFDSIYLSSYGTVLIDFEQDKYSFSLEIGSKSIGYFSEIDSVTFNFCEESKIDDKSSLIKTLGLLNKDFIEFYEEIS